MQLSITSVMMWHREKIGIPLFSRVKDRKRQWDRILFRKEWMIFASNFYLWNALTLPYLLPNFDISIYDQHEHDIKDRQWGNVTLLLEPYSASSSLSHRIKSQTPLSSIFLSVSIPKRQKPEKVIDDEQKILIIVRCHRKVRKERLET